jgi:hypothetical protein
MRQCLQCGIDISHRHGNAKHCGSHCREKWWRSRMPDEYREKRREWGRRYESKLPFRKTCLTCGNEYRAALSKQRHCYTCRPKRAGNHRSRRKQIAIYTGPPYCPPTPHIHAPGEWTAGQCRVCETAFISPHHDVTCSRPCQDEHYRRRRRTQHGRYNAKKRGVYVEDVRPHVVYERDRWKCHLCGKRIGKKYKSPHPRSASIDHIIPISLGGTHEYANVAAAHRICNSTKSNTGTGDQLALL